MKAWRQIKNYIVRIRNYDMFKWFSSASKSFWVLSCFVWRLILHLSSVSIWLQTMQLAKINVMIHSYNIEAQRKHMNIHSDSNTLLDTNNQEEWFMLNIFVKPLIWNTIVINFKKKKNKSQIMSIIMYLLNPITQFLNEMVSKVHIAEISSFVFLSKVFPGICFCYK